MSSVQREFLLVETVLNLIDTHALPTCTTIRLRELGTTLKTALATRLHTEIRRHLPKYLPWCWHSPPWYSSNHNHQQGQGVVGVAGVQKSQIFFGRGNF